MNEENPVNPVNPLTGRPVPMSSAEMMEIIGNATKQAMEAKKEQIKEQLYERFRLYKPFLFGLMIFLLYLKGDFLEYNLSVAERIMKIIEERMNKTKETSTI